MEKVSKQEKILKLNETGYYNPGELELLQEEVINDLYLKYLIEKGTITKEESGKPWVVNYPWRPTRFLEIDKSLYNTYVDANKDNQKGVAVYNFNDGRVIYNDELKELTDVFARGLMEYGIGIDSRVGIIANDAIEEPMGLLSSDELGARVKFFDYFKGPFALRADSTKSKIDILFIDEMFIDWAPIINEKGVPVVVLNATRDYSNTNYIPFDKIVALGASKSRSDLDDHKSKVARLSHDIPVLTINSSGTTGSPKPILHSHSTINSATQKLYFTGFPFGRKSFILKSIPSQLGLGSITSLYSGLVSGTGLILIRPGTKEEAFANNVQVIQSFREIMKKCGVGEEAILMNFASPMFFRGIHEEIAKIDDMSFVGGLLAAGSKMNREELLKMNADFKAKGCPVPINDAYGQNELAGGVTFNTPLHDVPGSAGYPVIGTDVEIVDLTTGKNVPNGAEGRIVEKSSSEFIAYDEMDEKTKDAYVTLADGRRMFNTKDNGYYNDENFLQVTGREERTITNSDFKLHLDTIEDKLLSLGIFKGVATVPLYKGPDEFPALFARLDEGHENMTPEDVINQAKTVLGLYEMPVKVLLIDKLPSLPSGKLDYKNLELIINRIPDLGDEVVLYDELARDVGLPIEQTNKGPSLSLRKKQK